MPLGRRRPLARAAMVGGAGYMAGKHMANNSAQEQAQNDQIADLQQQQDQAPPQQQYAPPAPAAPAAESTEDMVSQLQALKGLLDDGILTQAEFDMKKQQILAAS